MIDDVENESKKSDQDNEQEDVEILCKHCQHKISLHDPKCTFVIEEVQDQNDTPEKAELVKVPNGDKVIVSDLHKRICCDCETPEFYNAVISGKYFGWIEIHCKNCGKLVCYIDSSSENVYDFEILCKKCIAKKH